MKRNIIKSLGKKERKYALCMMLAGFAALNTGFTSQVSEISTVDFGAVAETETVLPEGIVGIAGAFAENVNTVEEVGDSVEVAENVTEELKVQAAEADINNVEIVEEEPVRENIVETSYGAQHICRQTVAAQELLLQVSERLME